MAKVDWIEASSVVACIVPDQSRFRSACIDTIQEEEQKSVEFRIAAAPPVSNGYRVHSPLCMSYYWMDDGREERVRYKREECFFFF